MDLAESFPRTRAVIGRLTDVLKCQFCSILKDEKMVLFFRSCHHFMCLECVPGADHCQICSESKDLPLQLVDDKNMLDFYRQVLKMELPSKEQIQAILSAQKMFMSQETVIFDPKEELEVVKKKKKKHSVEEGVLPQKSKKNDNSEGKTLTVGSAKKVTKCFPSVEVLPEMDKSSLPVKGCGMTTPVSARASGKKLSVTKRNPKGETPLHLACKKANFDAMNLLIDAGANPNAQDNAGWTPLHDAVAKGNLAVVKFLLENGAKANTPGLENVTPLHEAVSSGNRPVVEMLLRHGANIQTRNIYGQTPLDLAKHGELESVLLHTKCTESESVAPRSDSPDHAVLWSTDLEKVEEETLARFCREFDMTLSEVLTPSVTHVVLPSATLERPSAELVTHIPHGAWFLHVQWVKDSVARGSVRPTELYEVQGPHTGFQRARLSRSNQLPGLFSGCHFFFGGSFERYTAGLDMSRQAVRGLAERLGGVVLKRSPDPESLTLERTVPFHAAVHGSLAGCSHFIIYQGDKWDPKPKYNMSHVKTLPVDWFLACVLTFELIEPSPDGDYSKWIKLS